jgi:hypothetical protein
MTTDKSALLPSKTEGLKRLKARIKRLPNGCWEWQGATTKRGYGHLSFASKHVLAHRLMFTLTKGEIGEGLHVCHTCDNPPCINPKHLWAGTHSENMKDAYSKGRLDVKTPGAKGRLVQGHVKKESA